MMQQNTGNTPITPEMDSNEMLRTIKAMVAPYSYGVTLGFAWALGKSPKVLAKAADCPTVEEQLNEHLTYYDECLQADIQDDGNIEIIAPDSSDGGPRERVEFFSQAKADHPVFEGKATSEDPGVSIRYNDEHVYVVFDVPNAKFRCFEQGWATAVREVYATASKSPSLKP